MNPGTILFDKNFTYSDGTKGQKLLVILSDLAEEGFYVVAKTTSQSHRKGKNPGCQKNDIYPNFFIPKGSSSFPKDTWVDLDEFFEFSEIELIKRKFEGNIELFTKSLDPITTTKLLKCSLQSEDITPRHEQVIQSSIASLTQAQEKNDAPK